MSSSPDEPYKGLASFDDTEGDAVLFFGREGEREIIAANLVASRLTLLYGPSGVGKSSVLRAGVARQLRGSVPGAGVVVFSDWRDDPARALAHAAARAVGNGVDTSRPLADVLAACSERLGGNLLVILDQAEEYFVYHDGGDEGDAFADEFPEAVVRPGPGANFLVSLREDAVAKLDRFKGRIPHLFANSLRLEHLDRPAARLAILGPIAELNRRAANGAELYEIEPELVEAVLDETSAGSVDLGAPGRGAAREAADADRVEAPYLQLVMQRLWDEETQAGSRRLRLATFRELGGAERIARDHLERALAGLTAEQKRIAAATFDHLVTPSGTKIAHEVADLAGYAHASPDELAPVLDALARERIVRRVSQGSNVGYEIFHDVLAEPVLAWRSAYLADERVARERVAARRRQKRLIVIAVGLLAALAAMLALTVFAFGQRSEAQEQATAAQARQLVASAVSEIPVDPELAMLLALEAAKLDRGPQTEAVLRQSLIASRVRAIVTGHRGALANAVFSRDGTLVLTAGRDGTARIALAASGRTQHVLRHGGPVTAASFSRGGTLVLTASADGAARIWETATGRRVVTLRHAGPVTEAAFAPDGRLVATGSADGTATIWDTATGEPVRAVPIPGAVSGLTFDPTGSLLLAVSGEVVRLITVATGRLELGFDHESAVEAAALSPDGTVLVTAGKDYPARLWDATSGRLLYLLEGHRGSLADAAFSPDGAHVATASADGTARIWSAATGSVEIVLSGHVNAVSSVAYSRDGNLVATTSDDLTARVWDPTGGREIVTLSGHAQPVLRAAFSPDGSRVVTAAADGTARLWDPSIEPSLEVVSDRAGAATAAAFSPNGARVLGANDTGTITIADLRDGSAIGFRHGSAVATAAWSPDGERVVSAGRDGTAQVWDAASGEPLLVLDHGGEVEVVRFVHEGQVILSAGTDGTAKAWRASDGGLLHRFPHGSPVHDAAVSPDGSLLATAGEDGFVRTWNLGDGRPAHGLHSHEAAASSVAFSPDGTLVASGGEDGTAEIRTAEGELVRELRGHTEAVTDVTFSPDGSQLLTTSADRDARVWDTETGEVRVLRAHFGAVAAGAYSPDGRWIVTAGPGTAGLWDAADGAFVFYLRGHRGPLTRASFSPDGTRVLTAGRDGSVRIWTCDVCAGLAGLERLAEARLARTGRTLTPAERTLYLEP